MRWWHESFKTPSFEWTKMIRKKTRSDSIYHLIDSGSMKNKHKKIFHVNTHFVFLLGFQMKRTVNLRPIITSGNSSMCVKTNRRWNLLPQYDGWLIQTDWHFSSSFLPNNFPCISILFFLFFFFGHMFLIHLLRSGMRDVTSRKQCMK